MKIALVHDYIKEYGGAERVLEVLHEIWPKAPVYTTVYLPKYLGPHKERFKNWDVRTSWLQDIPFKAKLISPFRLLAPFVFRPWDLSKYDVVIVSATGAYSPNLIKTSKRHPERSEGSQRKKILRFTQNDQNRKKEAVHICYCHTPPRYLYGYPTARKIDNPLLKPFIHVINHVLRMVDFKSAQNVDYFIANSKEVKSRIRKFYRKDAVVINPPVDIKNSKYYVVSGKEKKKYYLAGGRLARAKRVDLAVKASTKLKLPLKVFGKEFAGYGEELRKIAGSCVEFLGEVTEKEKWKLMANAKAFLFPSESEDFGIIAIEAMAVGTPVIAYRSGGVQETVIEGKTGLFFDEPTVESLSSVIKKFDKMKFDPKACINHANKFGKERFEKEIRNFVDSKLK